MRNGVTDCIADRRRTEGLALVQFASVCFKTPFGRMITRLTPRMIIKSASEFDIKICPTAVEQIFDYTSQNSCHHKEIPIFCNHTFNLVFQFSILFTHWPLYQVDSSFNAIPFIYR